MAVPAKHRSDQAGLEFTATLRIASSATRRLRIKRFVVRFAFEQALILRERGLRSRYSGKRAVVRDAEALSGFALGCQEIMDAVLCHRVARLPVRRRGAVVGSFGVLSLAHQNIGSLTRWSHRAPPFFCLSMP